MTFSLSYLLAILRARAMTIVSVFQRWTAIGNAAPMCGFMVPSLRPMAGHDRAVIAVMTGISMVNDHHMMLMPTKGAEVVVK